LRCSDETYYTGITTYLTNRLKVHNAGKASKYTAAKLPVKIIYSKGGYTESSAKKEEAKIKSLTRQQKEKLISMRGCGF